MQETMDTVDQHHPQLTDVYFSDHIYESTECISQHKATPGVPPSLFSMFARFIVKFMVKSALLVLNTVDLCTLRPSKLVSQLMDQLRQYDSFLDK